MTIKYYIREAEISFSTLQREPKMSSQRAPLGFLSLVPK